MSFETRTLKELTLARAIDIKTGPFGTQLKASDYVPEGIPVVNVRNIGFGNIVDEKIERISQETARRLSAHLLATNDIIFGRKGAVERHAFVGESCNGWLQGSDCIRLRVLDKTKVIPRYISYFFLTTEHKNRMMSLCSHGSTMASLNQSILEVIEVPYTSIENQEKVVSMLKPLDDKIELNTRIIVNLEAQAQAIFDEWFMGLEADFPYGTLSDIAFVNPPRTLTRGQLATYIEMSDLSTRTSYPNNWVEHTPYNGGMKFQNGDTVIARITPCLENGKTAYISCLADGEVGFGSTEYIVLSAKAGYCNEMLYFLARNQDFRNYAIQNMNGSSGRQRVSAETISNYEMAIPTTEASKRFEAFAKPIMGTIQNCALQNRRLATLRDALLPKLMSGEIEAPVEG